MIKNIIFDLGGVVLKNNPSIVMNSLNIDNKDYDTIYNTFFNNLVLLDNGNMTLVDYFNKCNIPNNLKIKYKDVLCNYFKYREFNDNVVNLMKKLKDNNYKIYILSNNNKETYDYLFNLEKLNFIDGWIISSEYGIMKPDIKLYNILLDKYNLIASECCFIDDKEENINTSFSIGMKGFVFKNFDLLIKDLKCNKIRIV